MDSSWNGSSTDDWQTNNIGYGSALGQGEHFPHHSSRSDHCFLVKLSQFFLTSLLTLFSSWTTTGYPTGGLTAAAPADTSGLSQAWSAGASTGGTSGGGGGGGGHRGLNVRAQLSIERLPPDTSVETIRNIFGRYGRISRVVCDYKISDDRLYVWLDYEDEIHAEV